MGGWLSDAEATAFLLSLQVAAAAVAFSLPVAVGAALVLARGRFPGKVLLDGIVHLPLVLPPGCGFRVGGETREWRIGEAWVFDDTIEHAAWNDSDETRIILICDIWSPRLSPEERDAIRSVIAATDAFRGTVPGPHI